jgi:hypothetical protein
MFQAAVYALKSLGLCSGMNDPSSIGSVMILFACLLLVGIGAKIR